MSQIIKEQHNEQINHIMDKNKKYLFDEIYTDRDFDLSKKNPQIYVKTCEKMGESPSDTVVFEDALYAVESAKKAQCTVIGVYDEYSKCDWQNIKNIANSTIDWR